MKEIKCCRVCGNEQIEPVMSLGDFAVSDFLDEPLKELDYRAPLELVLCSHCALLQLRHTVDSHLLYRNYWYQSSINPSMVLELRDIASDVAIHAQLTSGDLVIDIGSNDGTLLREYQIVGLETVGFEPAANLYEQGSQGTSHIFQDFFSHALWVSRYKDLKAKAITAVGMFYDLDDPNRFVADVVNCLDANGVFTVQMMYLPLAMQRNAFDGICHEHLEYYNLQSLENLVSRHGLEVFDVVTRESVNEGSVRFHMRKKGAKVGNSASELPGRELAKLKELEDRLRLNTIEPYFAMNEKITKTKNEVVAFLKSQKEQGKKIHGYAASTKGNTTLQFYELDSTYLDCIADRNPDKWGKFTAGSHIQVVSEEESRAACPDYYLVLAWHFMPGFIEREKDFIDRGGKFIVPMPEFSLIGRD
jgi:NDP-4-keto-2,6-dideoxyhexose 3-C-methyltransferase